MRSRRAREVRDDATALTALAEVRATGDGVGSTAR
jgi:hypothetical protein